MIIFLMSKSIRPSLRLLLFSIFFILVSCKDKEEAHEAKKNQKVDSLSQVLQAKNAEVDSLRKRIKEDSSQEVTYPVLFGKEFSHIKNPKEYIITQLQKNKEKIPLKAVLGGTMDFREMQILSDKWIFAVYDDGHIQGKAIYEYKLKPNDSLNFSLILSDHP